MKFQLDNGGAAYRIQSYRRGEQITVNAQAYTHSLLLTPEHLEAWPPYAFEDVRAAHFAMLLRLAPECVIFGSGSVFRFPEPALLAPLIGAGIGVEVMDTGAACRTYTVLMAEGRRVAAALLIR